MELQEPIAKRPRAVRATAACEQCRRSKIKCNGLSPCGKCIARKITCDYREPPPNPTVERFEILESRLRYLEERFQGLPTVNPSQSTAPTQWPESDRLTLPENLASNGVNEGTDFRQSLPDVVSRGLIDLDDAYLDFYAFFDGCEQFVPVFDRPYDTFESIRQRSHVLFDTICTIGRRTRQGQLSPTFRKLNNELKTRLCEITLRQVSSSVEVVQALLVISCYTEKGWLLTSLATRIAMDIGLHQCLRTILLSPQDTLHSDSDLRKARVWLGTVNLDHIFSLDSGKEPNWQPTDAVEGRRCRILLNHPASRPFDARLISQVELNLLRAHAHRHISRDILFDSDLVRYVHGLKLDTNIWYQDWLHLLTSRSSNTNSHPLSNTDLTQFLISLKVIQCWAEIMISCKLIQHIGIENIDAMSTSQREIVLQAFHSTREHLHQLLLPPRTYLASFRFAMEFTHAKCAFSVLLLLKLAVLLDQDQELDAIVADAEEILAELAGAAGSGTGVGGGQNATGNVYFRILELSVAKARSLLGFGKRGGGGLAAGARARGESSSGDIDESEITTGQTNTPNERTPTTTVITPYATTAAAAAGPAGGGTTTTTTALSDPDSALDLQTFVPSEFVFEWDFPGLTLFSRPLDFQTLFTDFAVGL